MPKKGGLLAYGRALSTLPPLCIRPALANSPAMPCTDAKESGEELLLQFVQEALVLKSSGGRTGLYDQ